MDVPSEIVLSILSHLARPDLKSTRLVSKRWSLCAAEFLFDVIYISPSKEDIDVFQAITLHPVLSKCPRHLEYVGNEFLTHYSKEEYAEDLWEQTVSVLQSYSVGSGEQWLDPDAEINTWVNETVLPNEDSQFKDIENPYDCRIVNEGYRKYQEHVNYQQDVLDGLQSSQLAEILGKGLQHLSSLASVTLQPDWPSKAKYNCQDIRSGSPLARSWHIFYPGPSPSFYKYYEDQWQGPDGARHYLILSSALARARKRIRNFKVGRACCINGGVPQEMFESSDHSNTGLEIAAFSGLEHCDIALASYPDRNHHKAPENNVHKLQLLLASMDQLGFLSLSLPNLRWDQGLYPSEMIFSAVKVWSKLTTLKLEFVSTTATDLLQLLIFQMPKMRHLEL